MVILVQSSASGELKWHQFVLTPGRRVGAEEVMADTERAESTMVKLHAEWNELRSRSGALHHTIDAALRSIANA